MATRLFEPGADDVVYLIDLSGYVFRAYHAIQPLSSPSGEPTHAVLGTVNMLERLLKQCSPRRLAVAMDSRTPTFRKQLFPDYKANRPTPPEDLRQQMARVEQVVEAFAIAVFQEDGVEADDLIASAVARARERQQRVVIVSADKDLMQLVGPDVLMWDTMRDRVVGPDEVSERFGVRVDQLRDLLALTGDSSDNIPGVPSVGPKTARDLLQEYETLDGIFANLPSVKRKKLRETLEQNEQRARLSQELVTLKTDCELDFSDERLMFHGRNLEQLRELYSELGFARHLATLAQRGEEERRSIDDRSAARKNAGDRPHSAAKGKAAPEPHYRTITTRQELEALASEVRKAGRMAAIFTANIPDAMRARWVGLAIAVDADAAAYVPFGHRLLTQGSTLTLDDIKQVLGPLLASDGIRKAGHDLKRALVLLRQHGAELQGLELDSLLAGYLLDPESNHDLVTQANARFGEKLPTYEEVTKHARRRFDFDEVELDVATSYAARRANYILRAWTSLLEQLEEERLKSLHDDVELPLTEFLAELECRGVLIDANVLGSIGQRVTRELEVLEKRAHAIAGKAFNVNSPRQLETLLFDDLGLRPIKRTKTSRSTDAATLEALAEQHDLPKVILEIRQLSKLKGTYIDALPQLVHPKTGRIHTRWGQATAATGRLSSSDPNLQNIPIRSELGQSIRAAFIAPEGCELVSGDYSQIELRVLAHLSQDPVLIDAFQREQDIHTRTAMEIFEVPEDQVTSQLRRRAKAVNFGVIYGQGDSGLAKSLGISRSEAGDFIATYFRRYQGVRQFMDATLESARASDSVHTLLGRRRLVPDIKSANRARRLAAERIAMNMPIQGTAADILKLAMLALRTPVTPSARMVLTVHDELVFEVAADEVEAAMPKIKSIMENVYRLAVPLLVEVGRGKTWTEAH